MTNKKPDDSSVAGPPGGPGPASPGARPRPDDESTAMNELVELERRTDLDVTAPLQQLKESDLEDSKPHAPGGPGTDVVRKPVRLGWSVPAEKTPPVGAPAHQAAGSAAPEQDDTQEVRLDVSGSPKPADTSVSPPPAKRSAPPPDTTVSPPPQVRRASQVAVPAAHESKGADTTVSPPPARAAEGPSDTTVSPAPPARRPSQVAVPAMAEPKPSDTTVSPPPSARRASHLGVPVANAPEKPAADTSVSPPPARRMSPVSVPATDPSVPAPVAVEGAEATSETHVAPPAASPRRPSQVAMAAAHADLGQLETRAVHVEARPAASPLENLETKEIALVKPAPESIENLKTRDVHVEPRRPSKAEVPAANPVAAQEETREIAAPRPGAQVVPWKPSVPAPNSQTPASVIVHAGAVELQKVEPPAPKAAAPQVVLEVVGGHDIGRKVAMKGNRLTVGREPCDLNLADAAVALVHLELLDGPDGLVLHDRSGGAGTRVNGKEVSKAVLRPGDRIGLGRSILVVRRGAERKSPARKALEATRPVFNALRPRNLPAVTQSFLNQLPAGRWRKVAVGSIGLAVVVALIAIFIPRRGPQEPSGPAAPRVGDSALALADAEKLFDAKQYDAALRKGHDAQRLADGPEVRRFLVRCGEAIQVKRQIDSAEAAAARGQYDLALAKGRSIKAGGTLGARLEGLMKTWAASRDDAIVQNVRMEAQDGDFATARALIVRSPATMQGTLLREVDELESKAMGEKPRP